jgi:hypothetical protein
MGDVTAWFCPFAVALIVLLSEWAVSPEDLDRQTESAAGTEWAAADELVGSPTCEILLLFMAR